jgi:signal transduction histidine kinase
MEQVFSAVLTNALDASPADATIDVALERRAGPDDAVRAHVRIGDRGDGIPEARLRTVFTPFATSKKSGTGLGLSLAHKIVTAHHGTISIANREGGGTLVEISLPAGRGS